MRKLTQEEIDILEDNGESKDCIAVEGSIKELALTHVGTSCGTEGNTTFAALEDEFGGNGSRLVRGWFDPSDNTLCGMIHIQCEDEDEAERIELTAEENGGSLRVNRRSPWVGFYEFENE